MPKPAARTRTLAELLAAYPHDIQTLARQTRGFVLELLPGALETVDGSGPFIGYGYGPGYNGLICTINVSKTGVKLALAGGASLEDPDGLLEGAGRVHRHIVIEAADDLRRPGVKRLVRAAHAAWRKRSTS